MIEKILLASDGPEARLAAAAVADLVGGSVSPAVSARAGCPVLVVRAPSHDA